MTQTQRVESHDAIKELERSWPGWSVHAAHLDGVSERFYPSQKVILLDLAHWPEGINFACAHAMTHLDWCHTDEGKDFTEEQDDLADWVAKVRLDIRE